MNPETPIPDQLPPVGEPTSGTNVSLRHILAGSGVAVTTGLALTVRIIAFEVIVIPQLFVMITLYLLLFIARVTLLNVSVGVNEPPVVRLTHVTPRSVLTCH